MPQQYRLILKNVDQPGYTPDIDCYLRNGGYEVLKKALALPVKDLPDGKKMSTQEQLREEVKISGLRGRGGAGFSCGLKWSFVDRKSGKPIYLICNADESEPGTFKDRQIMYKDPHLLLEGMIISCFANDVHLAYIYIRGEMTDGAKILNRALAEARAKNFLGKNILGRGFDLEIHIHRGAGAYICGEETGLIESLEGKRAYPRIKPPYFPAVLGLYMCPTIVNNVETLAAVKLILQMGASEYAKLGTPNNTGTRIVSVSGHVKKPGYYEVEVGKATLGELIFHENFGAGLRDGRKLKAVIPGGSSAKVFKAGEKFKLKRKGPDGQMTPVEVDMLDIPYDFDSLQQAGSMSGSGAIIVMDDTTDIVAALANIADFYAHESCGQCTP
ncbi:MAG TPA: SLBB domain-containing protein, partial [Verrucomicrobiae bacterium]|nr:SLBB domain-containing protein [Verrucomicrobiae bacterium]